MDSKGYVLAAEFDEATDRLVKRIREMTDEEWTAKAGDDSWTVAQEALHLGVWMDVEGDWYARLAHGKPALPLSGDAADRINSYLMAENPAPTREQVLLEVAGNRTAVRHMLIGLSDAQLERTIPTAKAFVSGSDDEISLEDLARRMLPGHIDRHMQAIDETIDSAAAAG